MAAILQGITSEALPLLYCPPTIMHLCSPPSTDGAPVRIERQHSFVPNRLEADTEVLISQGKEASSKTTLLRQRGIIEIDRCCMVVRFNNHYYFSTYTIMMDIDQFTHRR